MRIAYIQPIGGASGDMLLGALVDAGMPMELLRSELARLPVDGYDIEASTDTRCEVRGTHLRVNLTDRTRYTPATLLRTVELSDLDETIKARAAEILQALWRAEARVHGETEDELQLEELGTLDTLVDVVGFCIGLQSLGLDSVYSAPLVLGEPSPPRRPGGYSNPAPATLELIAASGAPVAADSPVYAGAGELTTPTGAAIITSLAEFSRPPFSLQSVGVGLGTRDPSGFPNALRMWLGETADATEPAGVRPDTFRPASVVLLETNLDDAPGLVLGYTMDRLFDLGALDVWHTPVQMKKNRPGCVLSVLVPPRLEQDAVELILRETPTLGIRSRLVDRYVSDRETVSVSTEFGEVRVKVKSLEGIAVGAAPEPDDCRDIAVKSGVSFQEVYQRISEAARRQLLG